MAAFEQEPSAGEWLRQGDRIECSTPEEMQRLWPGARFSSTANPFYANALRLQFRSLRIETTTSSALTCERDAALIAEFPRPAIAVEVVLAGTMHRQQQGATYEQHPGQAALTVLDEPFSFTWKSEGRSVRTVSPLASLGSEFRRPGALRAGLFPSTPLALAYVGFLSSLVDSAQPASAGHRPLEAAAIGLHRAVLFEALRSAGHSRRPLRERIERHIDMHLTDPDLSPGRIAKDLSVSVRAVHGAFADEALTVAAEIRRRRVSLASALLADDNSSTIAQISAEVGFPNADRFRRSFLAVLGVTPTAYRDGARTSP